MALRVTPGMMQGQLMRNINHNLTRMQGQQNELSTGRKLNKPSDDPVGITYSLRYRSELAMNEQYDKNIAQAKSQLDHADTVLGQLNDVVQRVQELSVQALNGTNPQSALDAISIEVGQIYEQAVIFGNDQLNGKYIFNGQMTDKTPYNPATASTTTAPETDDQLFKVRFAAGVTVATNVTGGEVFGKTTDTDNLFKALKDIQNALSPTADRAALADAYARLNTRYDKIINIRSEVGARTNRIDLIDTRLQDLNYNLTGLQSKTEDTDMAETIMKYNQEEAVYQASLSTGAKIISPTLIDYLR
ncbi:flagellar hook-associated protein FlgL [Paenibacillus sp. MMS18-CY102]|uniref:flagellar hook-associated protein FlgL n=1 Tax=Paenibacillus sp. MMS18-CY102 TaxID=2682849 RepID=UPI0013656CCF|nr:flagellar hook-associated protein FlgL [Paenibacillus sp. MMS18-CY102]MWC30919.1 flagellar hook-associated protein 3 [Paenibacillus sp. MMS18-CY102]